MSYLKLPMTLPCGEKIFNRLVKPAMSENMAKSLSPGVEFVNAYKMWAKGGAGLLISGNVMVDSKHLGEPNNVVIEKGMDNISALQQWASSVEGTNAKLWLQLNHPGKQSPKFLNKLPVGPSAIPLAKSLKAGFNTPRELNINEISEIIHRFAYAAKVAKQCGFHGVQIHGAHGYLVSQFLSPQHNQRTDQFGGSLDNRMRFLKEVYTEIRKAVGDKYPVGVKINSADFSKGGFSNKEALAVAEKLSGLGIDMIEVSGGSYEAPVMMGSRKSTLKREAYFLDYTKEIKKVIRCPLMVTGGFRTLSFLEKVLNNNELDFIGIARPLALYPNLCNKFLQGHPVKNKNITLTSGVKKIDKLFPLEIIWYTHQIHRMGKNKSPDLNASVYASIFKTMMSVGLQGLKRLRS